MAEFVTGTGQTLYNVHDESQCKGKHCAIHNPSDHHMVDWPLHWRDDRGFFERICKCGVGHPDPDEIKYHASIGNDITVHGCCGCCNPSNPMDDLDREALSSDYKGMDDLDREALGISMDDIDREKPTSGYFKSLSDCVKKVNPELRLALGIDNEK